MSSSPPRGRSSSRDVVFELEAWSLKTQKSEVWLESCVVTSEILSRTTTTRKLSSPTSSNIWGKASRSGSQLPNSSTTPKIKSTYWWVVVSNDKFPSVRLSRERRLLRRRALLYIDGFEFLLSAWGHSSANFLYIFHHPYSVISPSPSFLNIPIPFKLSKSQKLGCSHSSVGYDLFFHLVEWETPHRCRSPYIVAAHDRMGEMADI